MAIRVEFTKDGNIKGQPEKIKKGTVMNVSRSIYDMLNDVQKCVKKIEVLGEEKKKTQVKK